MASIVKEKDKPISDGAVNAEINRILGSMNDKEEETEEAVSDEEPIKTLEEARQKVKKPEEYTEEEKEKVFEEFRERRKQNKAAGATGGKDATGMDAAQAIRDAYEALKGSSATGKLDAVALQKEITRIVNGNGLEEEDSPEVAASAPAAVGEKSSEVDELFEKIDQKKYVDTLESNKELLEDTEKLTRLTSTDMKLGGRRIRQKRLRPQEIDAENAKAVEKLREFKAVQESKLARVN